MSKVLRLHEEANDNILNWGKSQPYGSDVIGQIDDPEGMSAEKEITSIPSPFARMDLAMNAFRNVCNSGIDGNTIYHKMVSDCLDVGEILFNYDLLQGKVDIIAWDKQKETKALLDSDDEGHKILGRTLSMFLEQDAGTYNFKQMNRIYLLRYIGRKRKSQMDIIGGTSPVTLFFSSANNLDYLSDDLTLGGRDKPFDKEYAPLYKRNFQYQKCLYAIRECCGRQKFAGLFRDFDEYLNKNYSKLGDGQKAEIDRLQQTSANDEFEEIQIGNDRVEVLGFSMRKRARMASRNIDSDFKIKSSIFNGTLPLVLPSRAGNMYSDLKYISDTWEEDNSVVYDNKKPADRTLPFAAEKYPYLTINDFLEPWLITMPYEMADYYFDGNNGSRYGRSTESRSCLLPLKDEFFKYFTPDDLMGKVGGGKKMFEWRPSGVDGVDVTLRIPIQKGRYIEYTRTYFGNNEPNPEQNEGGVSEERFGLGVMPLVKFEEGMSVHYRAAFFSKTKNSGLKFMNKDTDAATTRGPVVRREPGQNCGVTSYVVNSSFDRIVVDIDGKRNVVIPKFRKPGNVGQYTFAVDFGTTNTHIQYSVDGRKSSHSFDIGSAEVQMARLHKNYGEDKDIQYAFDDAFVPDTIGGIGDDYSFPVRTAFAERRDINYEQATDSLADGNVPFRYEKAPVPKYNKVETDIKWTMRNSRRVQLYLDNIFFLMRNKVLLEGGRFADTKVIWFYPASMTEARRAAFGKIWSDLYRKYFNSNAPQNLICLTESVAPYHYYIEQKGAKSNVVTIDVGGGTTDVYVVTDNKPSMLSSFRFASNSIFGDGYNFAPGENGFVGSFSEKIENALKSNKDVSGMRDLIEAFNSIMEKGETTDKIAFFFSLSSNKRVTDNRLPIDFRQMLANDVRFKHVFIIYYGAILYYVACAMKSRSLPLPQTLAFSGNGSKSLYVLSPDADIISKFANLIFSNIYGEQARMEVILEGEPKLATSKGGLAFVNATTGSNVEAMDVKTSLLGTDTTSLVGEHTYNNIGDVEVRAVASNILEFMRFLFKINEDNSNFFVNSIGADAAIISKVKEITQDESELIEFTKQGLNRKREELRAWGTDSDAKIEETLFFYPIVPMLSKLAREISKMN